MVKRKRWQSVISRDIVTPNLDRKRDEARMPALSMLETEGPESFLNLKKISVKNQYPGKFPSMQEERYMKVRSKYNKYALRNQ